MKILIIIPAYNEAENIESVVDNLVQNYPSYDYIVINDCSTDSTEQICSTHQYNYLSLCTNLGIGGGVQTGYIYAYMNHYDYAVQLDGDGQHDPSYIETMITFAETSHSDMVIGSRFLKHEGFQSSIMRRSGISFLNKVIKLCCGETITDSTSGFRVINKNLIHFFSTNYAEDYPEPEAIVMASLNKYKIAEVPVIMNERHAGNSSIDWKRSIYYMIKVPIALFISSFNMHRRRQK